MRFTLFCLYLKNMKIYSQEKMISGMYMGELVRLALVRFTKAGLLFGGIGSDLLYHKGSFYTKYVSEIESDKKGDYTNCRDVMDELGKCIIKLFIKKIPFNFMLIIIFERYRFASCHRSRLCKRKIHL